MKNITRKVLCIMLIIMMLIPLGISSGAEYVDDAGIFRISCCVNGNTQTQRGFCWYTLEKTDTKVKVFADGTDVSNSLVFLNVTCTEWNGYYMHKVTVKGLTAGTAYTYQVGDGKNWSPVGSFTTDDGDSSVSIVAFADVQASSLNNFMTGARAVKAAFETAGDVDFMLNMGDFTNDSTNEEWNYYAEAFDEINLGCTFAPVAGNHDGLGVANWFNNLFNLNTSESIQTKNGVNYSFDYGNVHVAILNTNDTLSISDAQLEWLANDMKATSADWKIVCMHKTPYTLGKDGKWPDAQYLQEALTSVCDECDVDLIISGHDHQYLRTNPLKANKVASDGSVYVLCGTAGSKRYEVRPFSVDNFTKKEFINTMVSQKDGKYFNGTDFESQNDAYKGSCFNTITVDGGNLTFTSYVISDETDDITQIDCFTLTKETGKNVPTADSKTSGGILSTLTSYLNLIMYTLGTWLPRFLGALPEILKSFIVDDVF